MRLAIPMQFSKTTKRKTVFATGDGLVPTSNIYMLTEFLQVSGCRGEADSRDALECPLHR